jgi:hypothetical protein
MDRNMIVDLRLSDLRASFRRWSSEFHNTANHLKILYPEIDLDARHQSPNVDLTPEDYAMWCRNRSANDRMKIILHEINNRMNVGE